EVKLVDVVMLAAVHAHLGRGQLEDQPAAAAVDAGKADNIAQEGAIGVLVAGEDHHMRTADHLALLYASPAIPLIRPTASSRTASRPRPVAPATSSPARLSPMAIRTSPNVT